ncbi:hypothetical protein CNR22_18560 [Sphingobacteriaceae bacterium]|nr:hypothetical protein CNR22_18560 [Sphingobacteriaceae bacterium]
MKKNMGTADSLIRVIIAAIIVALFAFKIISGTLAIVLLSVSGIFILTSFIGYCPLYSPLKISTRKKTNS